MFMANRFGPLSIALLGLAVAGAPVWAKDPEIEASVRIVNRWVGPANATLNRVTLDVFWCSGDDQASRRALEASEIAASYATAARSVPASLNIMVVETRTRPLSRESYMRILATSSARPAGSQAILRFDASDRNIVALVDAVTPRVLQPALSAPIEGLRIPNYLAIYFCPDFQAPEMRGRLYFQVENADQTAKATAAAEALRSSAYGLNVAREVEVVGNRSPPSSELRYFTKADAGLAAKVAAEIQASTSARITTRHVPGYENKLRPGTLEAWISKQ